jgi:hypothetical protein
MPVSKTKDFVLQPAQNHHFVFSPLHKANQATNKDGNNSNDYANQHNPLELAFFRIGNMN